MKKKGNKRNALTQRIQTIQNNLRKNGVKVSMPEIRKWMKDCFGEHPIPIPKCPICEKFIDSYEEMGLDHIIPVSRKGSPGLENCVLVHQECNQIKGEFTLEEIRYLISSVNPDALAILKNRLKKSTLIFSRKFK